MKKVLLINRLGIGDVVLTTPLAELIKKRLRCPVGMLVANKSTDILRNHPHIDEVYAYNRATRQTVLQSMRAQGYTDAVVVDGRLSSTLVAWKIGCRLVNYGFEVSFGAERYLVRKQKAVRAVEDYASYICQLDAAAGKISSAVPVPIIGGLSPDEKHAVDTWRANVLGENNALVMIVPRGIAANKNWPSDSFGKINVLLNEQGITPLYLGGSNDAEYINTIAGKMHVGAGLFNLRQVAYLAEFAKVSLTPCTGSMHVIATAGTPIVALYGPTSPERWAPHHALVVQSDLPCVPCEVLTCSQPKRYACMHKITPQQVWQSLQRFL